MAGHAVFVSSVHLGASLVASWVKHGQAMKTSQFHGDKLTNKLFGENLLVNDGLVGK